ncbi:MOS1T-like protein, partial [Mya arenaria]
MKKVSARRVPRLLNEEERIQRVAAHMSFIRRWKRGCEEFLDRIITCDEHGFITTIPRQYNNPWHGRHQAQSLQRRHGSASPHRKRCSSLFMDRIGMLLFQAVQHGQTINVRYYQKIIHRDMVHAFQKKRPGTEFTFLHQDNAPTHRSQITLMTIDFLGLESILHSQYSLNLAQINFA